MFSEFREFPKRCRIIKDMVNSMRPEHVGVMKNIIKITLG